MDRLWSPWRLVYVTATSRVSDCIFCDAVTLAPDPDIVVFRGVNGYVILNLYPYNSGHLMVVPNRHIGSLAEASGEAMRPLERRENLQRCLRILSRDLPFIPLLVPHEIYGVRADLEWQPRLDGNVLAQEMRRRPQ